jgi:hypothetical protein
MAFQTCWTIGEDGGGCAGLWRILDSIEASRFLFRLAVFWSLFFLKKNFLLEKESWF